MWRARPAFVERRSSGLWLVRGCTSEETMQKLDELKAQESELERAWNVTAVTVAIIVVPTGVIDINATVTTQSV